MKEWAKSFYLSAAWEQDYVCERWGEPAKVVHHKRWLSRDIISNPNITLNWDNLEALCHW